MIRFALAVTLAALLSTSPSHATPVTWSFYETGGCVSLNGDGPPMLGGPCPPISPTLAVASLTLPDITSSGSANFAGGPGPGPIFTGDSFSYSQITGEQISPTFQSMPPALDGLTAYTLRWFETPSAFAVSVSTLSITNQFAWGASDISGTWPPPHFGEALIASDNMFPGCGFMGACHVTGVWSDSGPPAVPEPRIIGLLVGTLFLSATALFGPLRR